MAFVKYDSKTQSTTLVVADPGGQNEKVLAARQAPSFFYMALFSNAPPTRPSWSTDGRWIALAGINTSPERPRDNGELIEVDAASGAERAVRRVDGEVSELAYLDNDRLVVSFTNPVSQEPGQWRLYPRTGPHVPLTRDLNNIQDVQLTADRTSGVATRTTTRRSISVGTIATGLFAEVVPESGLQPAFAVLDARGNLLYAARAPVGRATFRSEGAGGAGTMVVSDLVSALPSPDGTFVVGHRPEVGLVRVNADGSGATVISPDASAIPRAMTPDGATLLVVSNKAGHQQPWLVPLAGGDARRLSDVYIDGGALWLSKDGRQVIFRNNAGTQICAFPGFDQCRVVNVRPGPLSADGTTVFAVSRDDPSNIIAQPLDGGPARPVTRFTDKAIQDFSLSPDGTRIAVTRMARESDVVLVKGLK
jgi:dipeptidyl aminopeptidase/acylaminoacyl peptidase